MAVFIFYFLAIMLSYLVEKGLCLFDIYKFETQYARLIVGQ